MATLLLSAAGAAFGGVAGGSLAGLSTMALGKAAGATLGSVLDQRLMGLGAAPVETGRVERFRVMGSSEGAPLPRVFGRTRVAGQLIWSSRFLETVSTQEVGGKGGAPTAREYRYSVSIAVALCEGEVVRVGRIWADGQVVDQSTLNWRLHVGSETQLPDPLIAAIEGSDAAPAYRGTAYVVVENLDLTPFGNRIPQFNFEVFRRAAPGLSGVPAAPVLGVQGVALVPGTGEYALATEPVYFRRGKGESAALNIHNDIGVTDLRASLGQLIADLPNVKSVSLVVSWFGTDLRCDRCELRPAVEQKVEDGDPMRWTVSGIDRNAAQTVSRVDDRPIFGGTPADRSVIQALTHARSLGLSVMFYPFILMDIQAGNGLSDPWSGEPDQPAVPWRGRITLSRAPGQAGSTDKTSAAAAEVAAFFGEAAAEQFVQSEGTVVYGGPPDWSYRRFILHYAHLCAQAGGVDAFCIGSEMRGLTQIRDGVDQHPAVRALCALAEAVRAVLGPACKIGYAADWSEYFGYHPADGSGDVIYHLDPLWAHPDIDFVGIDNYMPLSDWREGEGHADAAAGSVYDLGYLIGNVAGGEGFDWYYASQADRDAQVRTPIEDGAYAEEWVFRYKDLASWWSRPHVNRLGGVKAAEPTAWQPRSKPIWFTELGCPAVDKGTNQPNVFHDPKSSESFFPYYSSGIRDDFIQYRYLQAMFGYWSAPANNPPSDVYSGRMVDMSRAHVWAWDARPWPDFPNRLETWVDGDNYDRGHWLNGRASLSALAEVVAEISMRSGMRDLDVSDLYGGLTGYTIEAVEFARQSLQPLMLAYGFDSFTAEGRLAFANRNGRVVADVSTDGLVAVGRQPVTSLTRAPRAETAGRVTLGFVRSDLDYLAGAAEAALPDDPESNIAQTSVAIVLSEGEAKAVAERWLSESSVACDTLDCALPPSSLEITTGDVLSVRLGGHPDLYRVDRIEETGYRTISAVRIEPGVYEVPVVEPSRRRAPSLQAPAPVHAEFLDLPLLSGDEVPHAPHVAVVRLPWAGPVAVYSAKEDYGYALNREFKKPAVLGETLEPLHAATAGIWMRATLRIRIGSGRLESRGEDEVLNGANAAAIRFGGQGDWEVVQFQSATLVGPREYVLANLLRGQAGTDGVMPEVWPAGSDFVLLDAAVRQVDLPTAARGLARHYRIGPAVRPYDDPSYIHVVEAFAGVALRPYRPAHLAASRKADGGIEVVWIRRTRIDGDSWEGSDVPLGEERELYHLRVSDGSGLIREATVDAPRQLYSPAEQAEDAAGSALVFEVAQMSVRFGAGPYARIAFDG